MRHPAVVLLARVVAGVLVAFLLGQLMYLLADFRANRSNWGWQRATEPAAPVTTLYDLPLQAEEQGAVVRVRVATADGERYFLVPAKKAYGARQALHLASLPWLYTATTCGPPQLFRWHQRPPASAVACLSANIGGTENGLTAGAVLDVDGRVWMNMHYTPGYLVGVWMVGWLLFPLLGLVAGLWGARWEVADGG